MQTIDAINYLTAALPVSGAGVDQQGNPVFDLEGSFPFTLTEISDSCVRLSAVLDNAGNIGADQQKRLLETGYLGLETGSCAIALDPMGTGALALTDMVHVTGMDADGLEARVVDFILYAEYLKTELIPQSLAKQVDDDLSVSSEDPIIRA